MQDPGRLRFVLHPFGVEQKALASLSSIGSVMVTYLGLLIAKVGGEEFRIDRLVIEPEILLRKAEAPMPTLVTSTRSCSWISAILDQTRCFVAEDTFGSWLSLDFDSVFANRFFCGLHWFGLPRN